MSFLNNKHILVGVTGGIAAYKCADLVRRLRDAGASVRVAMTPGAESFVSALTFQAVSGQRVHRQLLDAEAESGMSHIELARWADAVIVAPATANFLARLAHGLADDLLTTLCLATAAPIAVAPAMNQQMWRQAATRDNVETLRGRGVRILGPAEGEQACGDVGPGRMLEPAQLVDQLAEVFMNGALAGRRVIVTAGATWEALDPVRGLTNQSSGKMGYAVAAAARDAGADVLLVSGPATVPVPPGVETVKVITAQEMHDAVMQNIPECDVFIAVAAVADYRPRFQAEQKIKKEHENLTIELVRNPDILASVAALPGRPYTVGFAAETGDLERHARTKLLKKGIDLIAANLVGDGVGFGSDDNSLLIVERTGTVSLPTTGKDRLARALVDIIGERLSGQDSIKNSRPSHR